MSSVTITAWAASRVARICSNCRTSRSVSCSAPQSTPIGKSGNRPRSACQQAQPTMASFSRDLPASISTVVLNTRARPRRGSSRAKIGHQRRKVEQEACLQQDRGRAGKQCGKHEGSGGGHHRPAGLAQPHHRVDPVRLFQEHRHAADEVLSDRRAAHGDE